MNLESMQHIAREWGCATHVTRLRYAKSADIEQELVTFVKDGKYVFQLTLVAGETTLPGFLLIQELRRRCEAGIVPPEALDSEGEATEA